MKLTDNNLNPSENVVYDAVGSATELSTQDNMTCSKNIAYATMKEANEDDLRATPTSNTPVYVEVSPRN